MEVKTMESMYFFYLKNGLTLTCNTITADRDHVFLYNDGFLGGQYFCRCAADITKSEFKKRFKHFATEIGKNSFSKHFDEV